MGLCRYCGAAIDWITTAAGRHIPVDKDPVFVVEGDGQDRFYTDEGKPITGRVASTLEDRQDLPVAFVPHFRACRRRGG